MWFTWQLLSEAEVVREGAERRQPERGTDWPKENVYLFLHTETKEKPLRPPAPAPSAELGVR